MATPFNRLLFRLVPSMPGIEEIGSGFLPTCFSPSLALKPMDAHSNQHGRNSRPLNEVVALLPTLDTGNHGAGKNRKGKHQIHLSDLFGSRKLNPAWAEWFMGYAIGHTELKDWGIQSSRKSRLKSSGKSAH